MPLSAPIRIEWAEAAIWSRVGNASRRTPPDGRQRNADKKQRVCMGRILFASKSQCLLHVLISTHKAEIILFQRGVHYYSLSLIQIAEGVEDEAVVGDSKEIDLVVRASAGEGEDTTDLILNTDGRASGGDATGRPIRRGRRTSMYRRVGCIPFLCDMILHGLSAPLLKLPTLCGYRYIYLDVLVSYILFLITLIPLPTYQSPPCHPHVTPMSPSPYQELPDLVQL